MNKLKPVTVLMAVLISMQSAGLIYFVYRARVLSKKLEIIQPDYQKLSREEEELKNRYTALLKEHEAIKEDRNNLLAQAKNLLGEKGRAEELKVSLDKITASMDTLDKEKQELQNLNLNLNEEVKRLDELQAHTLKERDEFKIAYEKARKQNEIKELKKEISNLQQMKSQIEVKSRHSSRQIEQLTEQKSKLETTKEWLTGQLKDYKRNYAHALKKNKSLEREVKNIPRKFTEIARQNKRLIRETAEMHYNLGVFYTKNKGYERAIAEFEKVVEITPDDSHAHFNLGYIYAEYLVNRKKAIENFRQYLRLAKSEDKDIDWVKKYLLTWETFDGKKPIE